jgi:hypothetical protein
MPASIVIDNMEIQVQHGLISFPQPSTVSSLVPPTLRSFLHFSLNSSQFPMLRINRLFRPTKTRDSFASQYIRLESRSLHVNFIDPVQHPHALSTVISAKNIQVPSKRIPAGIYIYINIDSGRHWKSAIKDLSSDKSVVWGDTVTLYV